ncbi:histone H2A-Bbd type 1 [Cricetulus griseus]|uniref:Histone H2A n=1 Tax=Cricetulus griseus TaxID=10029 RepID=G3IKM5_CRIGR|nr:histone H2A-Bbd type 1 [Cricetulus griseus]XP_027288493.1 histone H2A-Bbd type 1 [Cricetulus griseus]EGW11683.1 Late histone H2A.L3 [Cricetulus griseus]
MSGKRQRRSRSRRAKLQFPVSRVNRFLRERNYCQRLSSCAPVFLARIVEYLLSNILVLAAKEAYFNGQKCITQEHLYQAIQSDEELYQLFTEDTNSVVALLEAKGN